MYFRLQCLVALFRRTAENIAALHKKETWEIEYLNENGGITKLVLFNIYIYILYSFKMVNIIYIKNLTIFFLSK